MALTLVSPAPQKASKPPSPRIYPWDKASNKPTAFQIQVYTALTLVPKGRVTTYIHLARFVRCRSSQAVGQALKRNPYAPEIPCHRVVASDRSMGGYFGQKTGTKMEEKIQRLKEEGVRFDEAHRVAEDCIFTFSLN